LAAMIPAAAVAAKNSRSAARLPSLFRVRLAIVCLL
jgi:hypothetical protein